MEQRIGFEELDPKAMQGVNQTEGYIKSTGFNQRLLELIKYRVSQINGCAFCLDMHHKEAIAMGEEELRLHSLPAWRECPFYSDSERVAFQYAEALTNANQQDISDELYQELTSHYTKDEIVILTLAITNINTWNRINLTFRTTPGYYEVGQYG